jgi:hypothetical protein
MRERVAKGFHDIERGLGWDIYLLTHPSGSAFQRRIDALSSSIWDREPPLPFAASFSTLQMHSALTSSSEKVE